MVGSLAFKAPCKSNWLAKIPVIVPHAVGTTAPGPISIPPKVALSPT